MAAPYIGNNDYRGYLNYTSQHNDPNGYAGTLLKYVNNTAQLNKQFSSNIGGGLHNDLINQNNQFYKQFQQQQAQPANPSYLGGANILGQLGGGGSYAAQAPNWDVNAIYKGAGAQAAKAVNPYYTKQLNQFLTQQKAAKTNEQNQYNFNVAGIQSDLANQLQENQLSGQRTNQDVLQNEQQTQQDAQNRQADQGQQFDQARIDQAKQLATQGLTGAGVGNQQVNQSITDRNVTEGRQAVADQQQIHAQELLKARTFQDLANSSQKATAAAGRSKTQSKMDFDKFVQQQGFDLTDKRNTLENSRRQDVATQQKQYAQLQLNKMIHNISNPAQRLAASQAYGGVF